MRPAGGGVGLAGPHSQCRGLPADSGDRFGVPAGAGWDPDGMKGSGTTGVLMEDDGTSDMAVCQNPGT